MILKDITLRRSPIPRKGQAGLSAEEHLVLHVAGITQVNTEGEPIWTEELTVNGQVRRRDRLLDVEEDPDIQRWLEGLRSGNGRILQTEKRAKLPASDPKSSMSRSNSGVPPDEDQGNEEGGSSAYNGPVSIGIPRFQKWNMISVMTGVLPKKSETLRKRHKARRELVEWLRLIISKDRDDYAPDGPLLVDQFPDDGADMWTPESTPGATYEEPIHIQEERPSSPITEAFSGWSQTSQSNPPSPIKSVSDVEEDREFQEQIPDPTIPPAQAYPSQASSDGFLSLPLFSPSQLAPKEEASLSNSLRALRVDAGTGDGKNEESIPPSLSSLLKTESSQISATRNKRSQSSLATAQASAPNEAVLSSRIPAAQRKPTGSDYSCGSPSSNLTNSEDADGEREVSVAPSQFSHLGASTSDTETIEEENLDADSPDEQHSPQQGSSKHIDLMPLGRSISHHSPSRQIAVRPITPPERLKELGDYLTADSSPPSDETPAFSVKPSTSRQARKRTRRESEEDIGTASSVLDRDERRPSKMPRQVLTASQWLSPDSLKAAMQARKAQASQADRPHSRRRSYGGGFRALDLTARLLPASSSTSGASSDASSRVTKQIRKVEQRQTKLAMAHRSYSPYPSVDSASDYSPEPTAVSAPPKRRARGSMTAEERREARAHRNRLAAQASRDRKKVQHDQLCLRVSQLEEENRALRLGISGSSASNALDAALAKENAELRARVQQLELAWQNMTKILGSMAIPVPQADRSAVKSPVLNFPLSPAPTSVSSFTVRDCLHRDSPAAGTSFEALFDPQILVGAEHTGTTTMYNVNQKPASPVVNDHHDQCSLLLTPVVDSADNGLISLEHGYSEMDRLLDLLPSTTPELGLDAGLASAISNPDDWSWLNEAAF
ncbi:hypothetical protein PIIN_00069 [Serendipita indica DSM 11827]|uniref:BZIP domain-containing protein n=1 Tax=Serendipita indica (strain DSM 11827) TaxID=1109443 RepID=G4T4W8_SERID|nr:hypothetical protein PIIN_00069 [Serendipita indica DSM 11827]